MDQEELQPEQQPTPTRRPPETPQQVFKKYAIGTVALAIWTSWCIRDGWFREPGYEHAAFNKTIAIPSAIAFVFCLVMAASAGRTLLRQMRQPKEPPSPPAE